MMQVIPAIDLLGGKAVRLTRGDRNQSTVYSDEPWNLVKQFASDGADRIHVVDLDGAFSGNPEHRAIVRRIVAKSPVPIQVGGGIRDRDGLQLLFENGVHAAVIGTAAVKNPGFAHRACRDFPDRIVIAVDAKDGMVAVEGWAEATEVHALDLAKKAQEWGAAAVLYTDVARDGTGDGVNVEGTKALQDELDIPVIASGGVRSLGDLRKLANAGVEKVVIGRALYEEKFSVAEAISAVRSVDKAKRLETGAE